MIAAPMVAAFVEAPSPALWQAFGLTVRLALVTTGVLLVLGLPLARWLNTSRLPGVGLVEAAVGLPIILPPTVIGFYLLVAFAPTHFPGSLWVRLTGHSLPFTFTGLVVGSVCYSLPYAVQPFQAALRAVPREALAAARLEATPWEVFRHVHLPLAAPGVLVGATLAFAHTLGEFGVVLMLGGSIPGQTRVASIALYDEVQKLNYAQAHGYAAMLLVFSFTLLAFTTGLQRRMARAAAE